MDLRFRIVDQFGGELSISTVKASMRLVK